MLSYTPDWGRVSTSTGYKVVYCPEHPRAWSSGYIYAHIVVMEMKLGRLLIEKEIVHHKDSNKSNNSPENLELTTQSSHAKGHAKPVTMVELDCSVCGKRFSRRLGNEPAKKGYSNAYCGRPCYYASMRK